MSSSGPQVMDIIKGAIQGRSGSVASNFGEQIRNIQGGSQQVNNESAIGTRVGTQAPPPLSMTDMAAQNNFGAQVANPFVNMPQSTMTPEEMMGRGIGGNFGQTTAQPNSLPVIGSPAVGGSIGSPMVGGPNPRAALQDMFKRRGGLL